LFVAPSCFASLNAESCVEILVTADRVCGPKLSNLGFKYLCLYALLESLDRLVPWMCDVLRGCSLEMDRIKRKVMAEPVIIHILYPNTVPIEFQKINASSLFSSKYAFLWMLKKQEESMCF
jgi:hypothetical protein